MELTDTLNSLIWRTFETFIKAVLAQAEQLADIWLRDGALHL